jgi:hypothetical protein
MHLTSQVQLSEDRKFSKNLYRVYNIYLISRYNFRANNLRFG